MVGDGHLGIWGALAAVCPEVREPRCWNHRIVNVLDKLPKTRQADARSLRTKIPDAEAREEAERQKRGVQTWATTRGAAEVGRLLDRDWERLVTFYQFPREHWTHRRTSNPVESPFAAVRLRTGASTRRSSSPTSRAARPTSTVCMQCPGVTRRLPPPDLIYTLVDKTPSAA